MSDISLDIASIAAIVAAITVIGTPIVVLLKKVLSMMKKFECNSDDIESSKAERKVLIRGTLACLKGLEEQGCNGPVKRAIIEIESFLIDTAHT